MTEANIDRLRILFLKIQIEHSSNTKKKLLKEIKGVTEADIDRLHISFLRIQVGHNSNTKKILKGINGVT